MLQGSADDPGVVPSAVRDIFAAMAGVPERQFLLRLSMLEIYNEVHSWAPCPSHLSEHPWAPCAYHDRSCGQMGSVGSRLLCSGNGRLHSQYSLPRHQLLSGIYNARSMTEFAGRHGSVDYRPMLSTSRSCAHDRPRQVVNDLLDPGRPALRLREDRRRGSYVEGAREETLLDAEHALALIAAGDANRKVRRCTHLLSLRRSSSQRSRLHLCSLATLWKLARCRRFRAAEHGMEDGIDHSDVWYTLAASDAAVPVCIPKHKPSTPCSGASSPG